MKHEEKKLYAKRNPAELQPWFGEHMNAMTAEGLHSKGDIAMELAYRDKQIHNLNKIIDGLLASLDVQQAKIDRLMLEYCPDEMTDEQVKEWGRNQCPTDSHLWEHTDHTMYESFYKCRVCGKEKMERADE